MPHTKLPIITPIPGVLSLSHLDTYLQREIAGLSLEDESPEARCLFWYLGLRDNVAMGTHLINRFMENIASGDKHVPVILLYRHMLDLADSIGTLVRLGSTIPCSILVRALLESSFQFEFLLKGPSHPNSYLDRANCHLAFFYIKRLEAFEKVDPSTKKGIAYHRLLNDAHLLSGIHISETDCQTQRNELEKILNSHPYVPYYQEYKNTKKGKKNGKRKKPWVPRHWYSLCSRSTDIRALSRALNREAEYEVFYRFYSDPVHGGDVYSLNLGISSEGTTLIQGIRGPFQNLEMAVNLSNTYLLYIHNLLMTGFFQGDPNPHNFFKDWYLKWREVFGFAQPDDADS